MRALRHIRYFAFVVYAMPFPADGAMSFMRADFLRAAMPYRHAKCAAAAQR